MLFSFPLVLHPNKAHVEKERKSLSARSIIITTVILTAVIICNIIWDRILYAFSAAFLLSGISRIGGMIFNRQIHLLFGWIDEFSKKEGTTLSSSSFFLLVIQLVTTTFLISLKIMKAPPSFLILCGLQRILQVLS